MRFLNAGSFALKASFISFFSLLILEMLPIEHLNSLANVRYEAPYLILWITSTFCPNESSFNLRFGVFEVSVLGSIVLVKIN